MTAILNNIRELDARLRRGEITPEQYAERRVRLLESVETIDTSYEPVTNAARAPAQAPPDRSNLKGAFGFSIAVCFGVMSVSVGLILLVLPDLNLALTLGVTVLAALTVALFRALDD